ncbi:MAG: ABC transporter permease [Chloroflexi bacterium]|nr:ABC transporter permease [Chloroflexota bacterium]
MATQTAVAKLNVKNEERSAGESLTKLALRRLRRDRLTLVALTVLGILTLLSVGAPFITDLLGVSYTRTNADATFLPIGAPGHILGTDDLGRDHLARLLFAGQVSLSVGFLAAALSLSIGVSLGITTGYFGGVMDDFVNWLIATLTSIPQLFLLLIVAAVLSPTASTLIIVLGLLGWTGTTRLVRGETLSLREREYVVSARAIGASPIRIMFVHILPNLFSIIVITLAIDIGTLILVEAALSFLGLGIKPPEPSWGNMLTNAQTFFTKGAHLVVMPGLLIFITVLCLYVIGDGIRDAFDPTAKD